MIPGFRTHALPEYRLSIRPAVFSILGLLLLTSWALVMLVFVFVLLSISITGRYESYNILSMIFIPIAFTAASWHVFKKWAHAFYVDRLLKRRRWIAQAASHEVPADKIISLTSIVDAFAGTDKKQLEIKRHAFLIDETMIDGKPQPEPSNNRASYNLYDVVFAYPGWQPDRKYVMGDIVSHYTVFRSKLRRGVPYLVFESKLLRDRRLTSIYSGTQKLSLDINLDDSFATYSSEHYQIEHLSFITPEVIEAMFNLQECDIEFIDDNLFCYTPLLREDELASFRQRCLELHAKVSDNLRSYKNKPKKAAPIARRIFKSPGRHLLPAVIYGVISAIFIVLETIAYTDDSTLLPYSLIAPGLFVNELRKIVLTRNYNRRAGLHLK